MEQALEELAGAMEMRIPTYLHCHGGHGRTSTVVCCYLIGQYLTPRDAIAQVLRWRADLPKNDHPFDGDQEQFILRWSAALTLRLDLYSFERVVLHRLI